MHIGDVATYLNNEISVEAQLGGLLVAVVVVAVVIVCGLAGWGPEVGRRLVVAGPVGELVVLGARLQSVAR